ncbi:hypothetical protein L3Q82_010414, partial [Scortum barcoo]
MRFSSWSWNSGPALYPPSQGARGFMGVCPTSPHVLLCGSGEGIRPCPSCGIILWECSMSMGSGAFAKGCSVSVRPGAGAWFVHCRHGWDENQHLQILVAAEATLVLDRKRVVCPLRVSAEVLPQVEEFKYLGVLFTSEGKMEREIDRRIGAASAVMRSVSVPDRRARSSVIGRSSGSRAAAPSHREESAEVAWASISDAPGRLPREVFQACPTGRRPRGRPRTRWRDYVSRTGLAWERLGDPPGRAGGSVWGEGGLGISAQTAASSDPVPDQADENGWMDGCNGAGWTERDRNRLNKLVGCPLDSVEDVGERRMLASKADINHEQHLSPPARDCGGLKQVLQLQTATDYCYRLLYPQSRKDRSFIPNSATYDKVWSVEKGWPAQACWCCGPEAAAPSLVMVFFPSASFDVQCTGGLV